MKRLFALVLAMTSIFTFSSVRAETVAQMTYTVVMPDVTREGMYTGEIQNGVPHGYGVFSTVNTNGVCWHYLGEWANGEMCGQGGQYWDSGYYRIGIYEHNDMSSGTEYYGVTVPSGKYIVGEDIPAGAYTIRSLSVMAAFTLYDANGRISDVYTLLPDSGIGKIVLSDGQTVSLTGSVDFSPYIGLGFK